LSAAFDLQGHRGARGLKPENTLPSFETAFDLGVCSVETDLHLTRDGVVVLCHDPVLRPRLHTPPMGAAEDWPAVAALTLAELRTYRSQRNPDPVRFPNQDARVTPLAGWFAAEHGFNPWSTPTLDDLFRFTAAYSGEAGARADKTDSQRCRAGHVRFDLELKRVPFQPENVNDGFTGAAPGRLEECVVEAVRAAGVVARTTVRSFDHRAVYELLQLEPGLTGAVLVAETAPVSPGDLARSVGAAVYAPDYRFLDEDMVRRAHAEALRVVPWTVNRPEHARRLLAWGVDGLTTDFPDLIGAVLRAEGVAF
jgi:glycerophosphoryl diester phosphodiesterase